MNELIRITTNEQGSDVVSARELYDFLDVKSKFADWIKNRIIKYKFLENVDYAIVEGFSKILEKVGRPEYDYAITLDMAKELAMVENNEKGREARRYFIEVEKSARQLTAPSTEQMLIQLMSQSNQLLANQQSQIAELRADVNKILAGNKPVKANREIAPHIPKPDPTLRKKINHMVNEYCGLYGVTQQETYRYLYKRMFEVFIINVRAMRRQNGESFLDAIERFGHLDKLYSLIAADLIHLDEYE